MEPRKMKYERTTLHCQNAGKTMELRQQQHCRFGLELDRLLINLAGKVNFTFPIKHFHLAVVFQIPRTSQMQTVSGKRIE